MCCINLVVEFGNVRMEHQCPSLEAIPSRQGDTLTRVRALEAQYHGSGLASGAL